MAKRGKEKGKRGPYLREVKDPDQLGTAGIRLRQHRLARGWTLEDLASEAGVSTGTISGIENGTNGFSKLTLPKLAKAVRTTVGALFDVDPRPGKNGEFWPLWERASPTERQIIAAYAKGIIGGRK